MNGITRSESLIKINTASFIKAVSRTVGRFSYAYLGGDKGALLYGSALAGPFVRLMELNETSERSFFASHCAVQGGVQPKIVNLTD